MSGIAGFINNKENAQSGLLGKMSESIIFSRKSQIDKWSGDLLAVCRAHRGVVNPDPQPIFNEDRSLLIAMDGEVFDYGEQKIKLIHKGHKFKFENNDAEYCLHFYEEMGKDAFKEFNGSFCMIIYDKATHEIALVSDRFSSHPIFYALLDNGMLLFSTQISSLLQSHKIKRELDISAVFEFFTFQRVLGTKTFYKNIKALPPATVLYYKDGIISLAPYWEMRYRAEKHRRQYYVDALAKAIKKSMERRTRGKQRFGLLLSGGLDSRTVLAASEKDMECFTVGDFKNQEVKIAKRIAKAKGCKHFFLKRDLDHYINIADKAVEVGDGMYPFIHAHYIGIFDKIQEKCDILFHGFLLERLFRGTDLPHYNFKFLGKNVFTVLEKLSNKDLTYKIIEKLKYSLYQENPQQLFSRTYKPILDNVLINSVNDILEETKSDCANIYDRFIWFDIHYNSNFPSFLFKKSIMSFIDDRSVAFDNDLMELHLKMPLNIRDNAKIWKKALVKLDPKIAAIADANTGYSPLIPECLEWLLVLSRKIINKFYALIVRQTPHPSYTQGSWPNFAELIRYNENMKKLINDTIMDPECIDPKIFNTQRIKEMFEEHLNRKNNCEDFLFLLLTFGRWYKKYGPRI